MTDDGSADAALVDALRAYDGSPATRAAALAALVDARVFVGITATATAAEVAVATGLRAESQAELALVSILNGAGERAVPAFADTGSLRRWRVDVRPVPVAIRYLAESAIADGAAAVVVDPGGAALLLDTTDLAALAAGYLPVPGSSLAARHLDTDLTDPATEPEPALLAALAEALRPERPRAARLLDGPAGPVLGIAPRRPLDAPALAALAARVLARLGPALPAGGLDLAVVPTKGPGRRIGGRWRR